MQDPGGRVKYGLTALYLIIATFLIYKFVPGYKCHIIIHSDELNYRDFNALCVCEEPEFKVNTCIIQLGYKEGQ